MSMPIGKKGRWSHWPNFWTCPLPWFKVAYCGPTTR